MARDLLEAVADPEGVPGGLECLRVELGKTLRVEGALEVLEGERKIEDGGVYACRTRSAS